MFCRAVLLPATLEAASPAARLPLSSVKKSVSVIYLDALAKPLVQSLASGELTEEEIGSLLAEFARFPKPALQAYATQVKGHLERLDYHPNHAVPGEELDNLCFVLSFTTGSEEEKQTMRRLPIGDWLLAYLGDSAALDRYVRRLQASDTSVLGREAAHIVRIGFEDARLSEVFFSMLESPETFLLHPKQNHSRISLFYHAILSYTYWHGWDHSVLNKLIPHTETRPGLKGLADVNREDYLAASAIWLEEEFGRKFDLKAPFFFFPDPTQL